MSIPPHDPSQLKDYHVHNITYKVVSGHNIDLSVVVPKALVDGGVPASKKIPIIAELHGGGLVSGARLYSPWVSSWLLELAKLQHTILISPDHRLLPESNGLDILEDLASFWSWYSEKLEPTLASLYPGLNVRPDFDRLFVHGGSAGGYLAAQSMLLHPEIKPKAVNMAYPMADLRDDWWHKDFEKPVFGMPSNVPIEIVEEHLKSTPPGTIVTADGHPDEAVGLNRMTLALSIIQHGKFIEFYGTDTKLFPIENVSRVKELPPFVWVIHGKQDSLVPFVGSERFVDEIRKQHRGANLRFDAHDGDHGFDNDPEYSISSGWLKEAVDELLKHW